jgi:hypothetical protein
LLRADQVFHISQALGGIYGNMRIKQWEETTIFFLMIMTTIIILGHLLHGRVFETDIISRHVIPCTTGIVVANIHLNGKVRANERVKLLSHRLSVLLRGRMVHSDRHMAF